MNIKISTSRILQGVLITLHVLNYILTIPELPQSYKLYVMTAIGVGNILVNEWAHNSNPDGTAVPPAAGGTHPPDPPANK